MHDIGSNTQVEILMRKIALFKSISETNNCCVFTTNAMGMLTFQVSRAVRNAFWDR